MLDKKFILNADDFGLTSAHNQAVLEGYNNGFLTSASLCANGVAFDNAVHDILPDCPNLGIRVHLNIMEGKSLTDCRLLTDYNSTFNKDYLYYIFNQDNSKVLSQIEEEFRAQIEKVKNVTQIEALDSHVHTHAIPELFKITCKLAKEYNIKYVRTQFEEFYFVPQLAKHLNFAYPINILKVLLLQYFTRKNRKVLDNHNLKTNDFILGVGYTGMMDSKTIEYGLMPIEEECIVEALIHPCKYNNSIKDGHTKEFAITQNMVLKDSILRMGFNITNFKNIQ